MKSIIIPEKKSIIIPAKHNFIREHIADVKSFEFGGKALLQVKHNLPNTEILNGLGFSIPSPILSQYEWPLVKGKFKPFDHQIDTSQFLTMHRKCIVLNQMGTGKTNSCLNSIDYMLKEGVVRKVLIVAPLSTLTKVWSDALFESYHWLSYTILHGKDKFESLKKDVQIYIINHDGISAMHSELVKRDDIDLIVFDEASVLRNADTNIYKFMAGGKVNEKKVTALSSPQRRLWLLTGTPTPNCPTNCWALGTLINAAGTPKYFGTLKRELLIQISQFKFVPKQGAHLRVHEILQPAILYKKEDCLTLPPVTYSDRSCELSAEQTKMFKEMRKDMQAELRLGTVDAVNAADKLLKLRQILCGSIKIGEDEYQDIDSPNRISVLLECIAESNSKTIVLVPFVGIIHKLKKAIEKHYTVEVVNGNVAINKRDEIFSNFQDSKHPQILLAHPAVCSHGLNLTAASCIIWYSPHTSCDEYLQANERIPRPGQTQHMSIIHISGHAIEDAMYKTLQDRKDNQASALDLYRKVCE